MGKLMVQTTQHREGTPLARRILTLVTVLLFLCSGLTAQEQVVRITASALNVRTGPSTGYGKLGLVYRDQQYVSVSRSGVWHKIWYKNGTGWVHGSYLSTTSGTPARVTASLLNVRRGPSTGYGVVGRAARDSKWVIVGSSGSWKKIAYGGGLRWVHGAYLSTGASSSPPPSTSSPAPAGNLPTSAVGFVQVPASGHGYTTYSYSHKRWGTPALVYGTLRAAGQWKTQNPGYPRVVIGNVSLANGGYMAPHQSHRNGKDIDIRPISSSTYEGPLTVYQSAYSSYRNRRWIVDYARPNLSISVIGFQDASIYNSLWYVQNWSNHHHHMHIRVQ